MNFRFEGFDLRHECSHERILSDFFSFQIGYSLSQHLSFATPFCSFLHESSVSFRYDTQGAFERNIFHIRSGEGRIVLKYMDVRVLCIFTACVRRLYCTQLFERQSVVLLLRPRIPNRQAEFKRRENERETWGERESKGMGEKKSLRGVSSSQSGVFIKIPGSPWDPKEYVEFLHARSAPPV